MILETIVSTVDGLGRPNFTPMGITIDGDRLLLRPFRTSRTWKNLQEVPEGVMHVTDDVLLFARCAVTSFVPAHHPAVEVRASLLDDACSWKEFKVVDSNLMEERGRFWARVVREGRARDFLGFNRGKHAVIEATIAITRLPLLGHGPVREEIARLRPLVDKTGGPQEKEAFAFLEAWLEGGSDVG